MSTTLSPLSASVTRILTLTGFPKELKTKDIQAAFSEWENVQGGFRIKWIDDTSLLIVFNDAVIAKRAYLQALVSPPPSIFGGNSVAAIKPYDGEDAQAIIQNVNSRHNSTASRGHNARPSISTSNSNGNGVGIGHGRMASTSIRGISKSSSNGTIHENPTQTVTIPSTNGQVYGREPSPTLPTIPAQPTLNSLIFPENVILNDPAILAASGTDNTGGSGPRIGEPGKRMLGAALGVRHPGLAPRSVSNNINGGSDQVLMREMQKSMNGLLVSD